MIENLKYKKPKEKEQNSFIKAITEFFSGSKVNT